jgi:hypothetical protein
MTHSLEFNTISPSNTRNSKKIIRVLIDQMPKGATNRWEASTVASILIP